MKISRDKRFSHRIRNRTMINTANEIDIPIKLTQKISSHLSTPLQRPIWSHCFSILICVSDFCPGREANKV